MTIACGIDLGTNSFRLLVAAVNDGRIVPLHQELATVRLGQGLAENGGVMGPEAMARGLDALRSFRVVIDRLHPQRLRVCATHALRVAQNRNIFIEKAASILNAVVEVVSPAEEAILSLAGAQQVLGHATPMLLADVGGGSSELAWRDQDNTITTSVEAGAVSLTERFLPLSGPARRESLTGLRQAIAGLFAGQSIPCLPLVGSGGTATACAAWDLGLTLYDAKQVQGHRLTLSRVHGMIATLASMDREGRNRLPGMAEGRGEIALAGILIYEHLLVRATQETLTVSDAGLLEGILLSSLEGAP